MSRSPTVHSRKYSPSKSSIWLRCPLSTFYNDSKNQEVSPQAEFGTQCHELGAVLISKSLGLIDYDSELKPIDELVKELDMYSDEMQDIADGYANFVINTIDFEKKRSDAEPFVVIEQLLDMDFDEDARGTLDCGIISSMNGGTLTVIDLKTGRLPVYAFDTEEDSFNTQLAIYALYLYKVYKDLYPVNKVRLVIYQPVINNTNEYEMDLEELLKFETEVLLPAVEKTRTGYLEGNTGKHCRYCSGRFMCVKRGDEFIEMSKELIKPLSVHSDEKIEEFLPKLDDYIRYANELKEFAINRAKNGHKWNGFKLVHARVSRKVTDEAGLIKACEEIGIDPYSAQKVAGITELTKRIGKDKVTSIIGPYITMQTGSMILVPETDPREEVTTIEKGEK